MAQRPRLLRSQNKETASSAACGRSPRRQPRLQLRAPWSSGSPRPATAAASRCWSSAMRNSTPACAGLALARATGAGRPRHSGPDRRFGRRRWPTPSRWPTDAANSTRPSRASRNCCAARRLSPRRSIATAPRGCISSSRAARWTTRPAICDLILDALHSTYDFVLVAVRRDARGGAGRRRRRPDPDFRGGRPVARFPHDDFAAAGARAILLAGVDSLGEIVEMAA